MSGSKALVAALLQGTEAPRYAVGPLAVHYCAYRTGVPLERYTLDPQVLADCVVRYYDTFHPDAVWISADTWVSAEAMGASVAFPYGNQPLAGTGTPAVRSLSDIEALPTPDPHRHGRWPLMLEATRLVRKALGDVFVVACFDQYPFSLACALLGMERVMLSLTEDRTLLDALLPRCAASAVAYAQALADAGADMLSGGDSPAGLLGPRFYREVALPYEQRVIAQLHAQVDIPVSLHICGNATPILEDMAASGADVLELDQRVDLAQALRRLGPTTALWGNLDPVGLLTRGTAEQVDRSTRALLQTAAEAGHRRLVISSGCTLAAETPAENLEAMVAAVQTTPFATERSASLKEPI